MYWLPTKCLQKLSEVILHVISLKKIYILFVIELLFLFWLNTKNNIPVQFNFSVNTFEQLAEENVVISDHQHLRRLKTRLPNHLFKHAGVTFKSS